MLIREGVRRALDGANLPAPTCFLVGLFIVRARLWERDLSAQCETTPEAALVVAVRGSNIVGTLAMVVSIGVFAGGRSLQWWCLNVACRSRGLSCQENRMSVYRVDAHFSVKGSSTGRLVD